MPETRLEALLNALIESPSSDLCLLYTGQFDLRQNRALTIELLTRYAQQAESFPSFEDFKALFDDSRFTEKAPQPTDPEFQFKHEGLDEKTRQVKQAHFYLKAKQSYEKRLRQHQTLQARSRAFTQGADASFGSYLSCIGNLALATDSAAYPQPLPEAEQFFFNSPQNFYINEKNRERHTYITAMTGHGKSVTIEVLVHHYLTQNTNTAVILLDPHGDLANACGRLLPNLDNDRLVYIKPAHDSSFTPILNPFDLPSRSWDTINKASDALIEVFKEVMKGDGEGSSFTPQMTTILKPCLSALLHMKDTSFVDLMRFLDDDPDVYQTYRNYGKRVLTNPMHKETLGKDFEKDTFNPSKLGIRTKLRNLLNDDHFFNFLVGQSTFDLKKEMDRKAVILFDLSNLSKSTKKAIGRFIMASITTIANSRAKIAYERRTPTHLFIDECQNFISESMESILNETRKFRLHGTFAQQFTGQGMDAQLKKAVIGNSAVKITGNNSVSDLKIMSAENGISVEDMQQLKVGEFYVQSGKGKPCVRVKMPYLGKDTKMTKSEWSAVMDQQVERYYQPLGNPNQRIIPTRTSEETATTHNTQRITKKKTKSSHTPIKAPGKQRGQYLDPDPFKN